MAIMRYIHAPAKNFLRYYSYQVPYLRTIKRDVMTLRNLSILLLCVFSLLPFSSFACPSPAPEKSAALEVFESYSLKIYRSIAEPSLDFKVFQLALKGYLQLQKEGKLSNPDVLSIVDFRKSSNQKRFFLIDMDNAKLVLKSLVAHGRKSGEEFATSFSNVPSSLKSSLGFFVTGETYMGENGLSLKLDGAERNVNDKARDRAVVVHAADYVSEAFIRANKRLGRSFGCPALPKEHYTEVVNKIKDGSCMFLYYPEKKYLQTSHFLNAPGFFDYFIQQVYSAS